MGDSCESSGVNTYNLESLDIELNRSQAPCHWAIRPVVLIDGGLAKTIVLDLGYDCCRCRSMFAGIHLLAGVGSSSVA